ncbi:hypothetical protein [Thermogemmatispora tikiterensis]|uniref:hypothetical protein n=1 Tax=Thermogemmatispora tikiterensis TaxID=1825093 RepID=UPI0011BDBD34|nr:hypothetical protein [Thermogemmatispora tikiterensis]
MRRPLRGEARSPSDWLGVLLSTPATEYSQFAAALAFLGHLPPAEVAARLEKQVQHLQEQISNARSAD